MNPHPWGWGIPAAMTLGNLYGHKRGLFRNPAKWGIPTATFGDFFKAIDTPETARLGRDASPYRNAV